MQNSRFTKATADPSTPLRRTCAKSTPTFRSGLVVGGPLADAEDDEFGGLDGGDADVANEAAVVEIVLGHGGAIAADEEGLVRRGPEEASRLPFVGKEVRDSVADARPERVAVGLEDDPLRAFVDGAFDGKKVAAEVDVFPI